MQPSPAAWHFACVAHPQHGRPPRSPLPGPLQVVEPILLEVDQIFHLACPASPVHYK